MKNRSVRILIFLVTVVALQCHPIVQMPSGAVNKAKSMDNKLEQVAHHHGKVGRKDFALGSIELGLVVFYFSEKPTINTLSNKTVSTDQQEMVIFFPKTQAQGTRVKNLMRDIEQSVSGLYTVKLEEVNKPTNGIKFLITYNPKKVGITYDFFPAIKGEKGVVVHFFNLDLLKEIDAKSNKPILSIASAKKTYDVVIDCGHGGDDFGALGYCNLKEKDVTLAIGKQLADELKKKGFNVFMTRTDDLFVALDARTSLANAMPKADLFVSIHANSSANKKTAGIETYCMDPILLKQQFNTLDSAHMNLVHAYNAKRFEHSKLLAKLTHQHVVQEGAKKNPALVDRKIRHAVSQVLLGTGMPAALIEIGFLSNKEEASMLGDAQYQHTLAQGICKGVVSYFNACKLG